MISYSVPAEVRPQHCLLCLLSGPGANALPKRVKDGAATKRCIRCWRENTMWLHSKVFPHWTLMLISLELLRQFVDF